MTAAMDAELAAAFEALGCVRMAAFHPRKRMEPVRRQVQEALERLGLVGRDRRGRSGGLHSLPPFQQTARLATLVQIPGIEDALITRELQDIVGHIAHRTLTRPPQAQLLLSLPQQGAWTLERLNWHVDVKAEPADRLPGVQAFVLIDDVAPRGGGTLALAGAQRMGGDNKALRELLNTPGMLEARLRERGMSIIEMSGRAGDVFLMDMRLLHTPSINATKHVRMMATARFIFPP